MSDATPTPERIERLFEPCEGACPECGHRPFNNLLCTKCGHNETAPDVRRVHIESAVGGSENRRRMKTALVYFLRAVLER